MVELSAALQKRKRKSPAVAARSRQRFLQRQEKRNTPPPTGVAEYSTPVNRDFKDLDQTYEKAKKGQKTSIF